MDYLDTLMESRIDCETADLIERLLQEHLPELTACSVPLETVLRQIREQYPFVPLSLDSIHYGRTALAVIETYFPNDAEYLPFDPESRVQAACSLIHALKLDIHCLEVIDKDAGHALYQRQRVQFEQRTAGLDLKWRSMPIRLYAETTTGYCLVTGSDLLRSHMIYLRGVSQFDIDTRSPALIAYLRAKHDRADI